MRFVQILFNALPKSIHYRRVLRLPKNTFAQQAWARLQDAHVDDIKEEGGAPQSVGDDDGNSSSSSAKPESPKGSKRGVLQLASWRELWKHDPDANVYSWPTRLRKRSDNYYMLRTEEEELVASAGKRENFEKMLVHQYFRPENAEATKDVRAFHLLLCDDNAITLLQLIPPEDRNPKKKLKSFKRIVLGRKTSSISNLQWPGKTRTNNLAAQSLKADNLARAIAKMTSKLVPPAGGVETCYVCIRGYVCDCIDFQIKRSQDLEEGLWSRCFQGTGVRPWSEPASAEAEDQGDAYMVNSTEEALLELHAARKLYKHMATKGKLLDPAREATDKANVLSSDDVKVVGLMGIEGHISKLALVNNTGSDRVVPSNKMVITHAGSRMPNRMLNFDGCACLFARAR